MILLDSLYINNGGGKVLLDYLVYKIEQNNINCYYLFDERCRNDFSLIPDNRKMYLKASLYKRHQFYRKNKLKFSKVLCFGNLPPTINLDIPTLTYFHQPLFLEVPESVSDLNKSIIKLKTIVLNQIKENTDIWLIQSESIKKRLSLKYNIDLDHIKIMPFYPPFTSDGKIHNRRKDGFAYISNSGMHKNHFNLIEGFCKYYDIYKHGILHLTVGEMFPEVIKLVKDKSKLGYPIINHGFIDRDKLVKIYQSNKFLIFPSLAESFGLGLVEALENGCNVIGADLPYTYEVCNPSIVFNPLDVSDIKRALIESQSDNVKETEQVIFNQIDDLILLLKE